MYRVRVNISNALAGLSATAASVESAGTKSLDRLADEIIIPGAERDVPVLTGRLKRSIGKKGKDNPMNLKVGADAPYAGWVHNGEGVHRVRGPRPFLGAHVNLSKSRWGEIYVSELR